MSLVLVLLFVLFLLMGLPVAIVIGASTMAALNLGDVPLMVEIGRASCRERV